MRKKLLSIAALAITGVVSAQVSDISITGAPTANYTWWDNNTAIKDGVMYGGQLGFGFGRGLELRAIYEKSADLKSTASKIINDKNIIDKFESRKVDVTRWGGEFKGNIPTNGWLAPYFTLGSGIQTLKVDDQKQQQIYATAGLGTKFNISERVTFNVEGKAFAFNMDPSNVLYERKTGSQIDNWVNNNISEKQMINWSLMAGLQFYLGGKDPKQMTALERAYDREFGGGLRGFKFVVEPGVAYVDFDKKLNLRDSYFIGGSAGFDITEFVGIRGFYYQASKNGKITTDWDKASFYGGDFLARLNVARGVVPYITVGGGYMNVYDSYKGKDGVNGAKSGYFAKGGGGVTVPLSTFMEAYGSANLLLTTDSEDPVNGLKSPDQIRKNIMYAAGLRLKLGAKADASDVLSGYVDREADKRLEDKNKRIAELEKELEDAYKHNDADKAVKVIKEKQQLEETYRAKSNEGESRVKMSPKELQDLVKEVIEDVETKQNQKNSTEDRIDRLERLLLEVNTNRAPAAQPASTVQPQQTSSDNKDINQQILEELKKLNAKNNNAGQGSTVVVTGGNVPATSVVSGSGSNTTVQTVAQPQQPSAVDENGNVVPARSVFFYKGVSAFAGVNFGGATTGMFGLKAHYGFTNSNIEFTPDLMFGLGKTTIYGFNANILFPFDFEKGVIVKPYAGIGLGLNNFDNNFSFGSNLIIGTSFNVLNGQLYVDYTSRNLFDNNQIAVGYRFGF